MKRWMTILLLASVAGCTNTETSSISQEATACPTGGNYPYAKLPKIYAWPTQVPAASSTQTFVAFLDPTKSGSLLVMLADPTTGDVSWATRALVGDRSKVRSAAGNFNWIDVGRTPPPPPPVGDDGFLARYALEAARLGDQIVPPMAADFAQ